MIIKEMKTKTDQELIKVQKLKNLKEKSSQKIIQETLLSMTRN